MKKLTLRVADTPEPKRSRESVAFFDVRGNPIDLLSFVGTPGPEGPAGADGEVGPQGPAGQDGSDGAPGADGAPGVDGADGQDGVDNDRAILAGLKASNWDPVLGAIYGVGAPSAGVLYLSRMVLLSDGEPTHVMVAVEGSTAGSTFAGWGIYDETGELVARTANQSAAMASNGIKTFALTVESGKALPSIKGESFWIGALFTGTMPQFIHLELSLMRHYANGGNDPATLTLGRFAGGGTGLTNLPATLPAPLLTTPSKSHWVGLK